jgi:hypothetical protein
VINIKTDLREKNGKILIGLIWLRIGTSEGLSSMSEWVMSDVGAHIFGQC